MFWFKKKTPVVPASNEDFHFHGLMDAMVWFAMLSTLLWFFGGDQLKDLIDSADKSAKALGYLKSNPVSVGIAIVSHLALLSWIRNKKGLVIGPRIPEAGDKDGEISIPLLKFRFNVVEMVYSMFVTVFLLAFIWHIAKVEMGHPWWLIFGYLFLMGTMEGFKAWKPFPGCIFIVSVIGLGVLIAMNPHQMTWPLILTTAILQPFSANATKAYAAVLKDYAKCEELESAIKTTTVVEMFSEKQGLLLFAQSRSLLDISAFMSIFIVAYGLTMGFNLIAIAYIYASLIVFYAHFAVFLNGIPIKVDVYVEGKTYKGARLGENNDKKIELLLKNNDKVVIPASRILRIEKKA